MLTRRLLAALASAAFLVLLGCREEKIAYYRVKKEVERPPAVTGAPAAGLPRLQWKTPAGWEEQPAGSVRIASFGITADGGRKADVSVTQFPGDVGGDLANVNRWRNQLQLGPINESELAKYVTTLDLPLGQFLLTEMVSESAVLGEGRHAGMVGAWLKQPDRTWFFKLAGDSELVAKNRDAFIAFLRSLEFTAPEESPMPVATAAVPTAPSSAAPLAAGSTKPLTWTAPASWTAKPLGAMRKGSYTLQGANGTTADLSIISFPGDAGGMAENLNRWRGQVKLEPLPPAQLASSATTLANAGLRFTIVDFLGTGSDGATRLLGAVLPLENETYFFKLMGPDAVVSQHKAAFLEFLKTVKAP